MPHGRGRVWAVRVGLGVVLAAAAAGGYAALNWENLSARYAAHRFRTAGTDDDRNLWAAKLVALGDAGMPAVVDVLRGEDPAWCAAATAAVRDHLDAVTPADPRFAACCRPLFAAVPDLSATGADAALDLVPDFLKSADPTAADRCRALVKTGLAGPTADGKVRAVRLALRPDVGLKADVAPLLDDPAPEVRRAAMLAVGPPTDDAPVVDDEALFRCLHDADPVVRDLCESALHARGLSDEHVALARKLTDPEPGERLRLLLDLRWPGDAVRDPGPWLERLSRDADPAVRAGAVRVAFECGVASRKWADRLADADPDLTVRRLAGYYRGQAGDIRQTGFTSGD